MKPRMDRLTIMLLSLVLSSAAQVNGSNHKLIDPSTFGGPENHVDDHFVLSECQGHAQDVNDAETLAGWADTRTPDPYGPDFCQEVSGNAGCSVQHEQAAETSSDSTNERGYVVHGECSVSFNKANTLTGYCQGMVFFSHTCAIRPDASQCPIGQKAKEPGWVPCGNSGPIKVDGKRFCEFQFP